MIRRDIKTPKKLGMMLLITASVFTIQLVTTSQSKRFATVEGWDDLQEASNQENITRSLRSARPDAPPLSGPGSLARPCGTDLEQLRQILCQIRSTIEIIVINNLSTIAEEVMEIDSKIGELDQSATSTSVLVTPQDIDMDQLTVIEWLKSIYLLLRGW